MALESPAYVISASSHSAALFRQAAQSMLAGTGVVGSGDLAATQNGTPNMSVNVAAGQVWMPGTLGATTGFPANYNGQAYGLPSSFDSQGSYYGYQDGTVNLAIAAASPSLPRIDIVCASVQDAQYAGAANQPVLQVITGTPASSPSAPSAPASTVVICQVAVAANATSITNANVTDERPFAQMLNHPSPAHARVYRNAAFSTGVSTVFAYDTVVYDGTGSFSTGTAKYTCPVAGYYRVFGQVAATATAANQFLYTEVYHNGSETAQSLVYSQAASQPIYCPVLDVVKCAAGDTLNIGEASTGLTGGLASSLQTYATFDLIGLLL
jgi:hypothetical protein